MRTSYTVFLYSTSTLSSPPAGFFYLLFSLSRIISRLTFVTQQVLSHQGTMAEPPEDPPGDIVRVVSNPLDVSDQSFPDVLSATVSHTEANVETQETTDGEQGPGPNLTDSPTEPLTTEVLETTDMDQNTLPDSVESSTNTATNDQPEVFDSPMKNSRSTSLESMSKIPSSGEEVSIVPLQITVDDGQPIKREPKSPNGGSVREEIGLPPPDQSQNLSFPEEVTTPTQHPVLDFPNLNFGEHVHADEGRFVQDNIPLSGLSIEQMVLLLKNAHRKPPHNHKSHKRTRSESPPPKSKNKAKHGNKTQRESILNPSKKKGKKYKQPAIDENAEIVNYDPIAAHNAEPELGEAPSIETTNKEYQLKAMLAGCPNRPTRQDSSDKEAIKKATQVFGRNKVKALNGLWVLTGMKTGTLSHESLTAENNGFWTGLYHHQILGAAWMHRREVGGDGGPLGGILADVMGLGKTLQTLAVSALVLCRTTF